MSAFTYHPKVISVVKATMDARINAMASWKSGRYSAKEIGKMYDVDERTVRRWKNAYESGGVSGLAPKKTGPIKGRPSQSI